MVYFLFIIDLRVREFAFEQSVPVQPDVMGASWHAEQRFDAVNERLAQFKHGFPLRSECEFSALFDR
jgi:hypothetical protein